MEDLTKREIGVLCRALKGIRAAVPPVEADHDAMQFAFDRISAIYDCVKEIVECHAT